uniref:Secreted protein n=1 Tax=Panagrolaimus davidi TaxID=227884 RepID=A0A914PEQ6_9BILA
MHYKFLLFLGYLYHHVFWLANVHVHDHRSGHGRDRDHYNGHHSGRDDGHRGDSRGGGHHDDGRRDGGGDHFQIIRTKIFFHDSARLIWKKMYLNLN